MTIVEDAPETEMIAPAAPSAPVSAPARRPVPIAVALLCMVAALALCWGLLALTEGPFGRAWYETRQNQLASGLQAHQAHVLAGQALGILQIPRPGVNLVVQEGDDVQHLRSGPGHHPGTPRPGQIGNSVIVGHRSGWGAPFADLHTLHKGDLIAFQGRDGLTWVFTVKSVQSNVSPTDQAPFAESNDHRLTLITDSGGRYSDRRLVVTAVSGAPAGRKLSFGPPASPVIEGVSTLANEAVLLLAAGVVLGAGVLFATRRRYRRSVALIVASPFVVLALIGLLLELDFLLPPLH
jgi:sortase A